MVVVCPCTLFQNWQREARMVGILGGGACASGLQDSCVRLVSWAKIPPVSTLMTNYFSSFVLICDEAHAMQTISSARTQAALSLCRSSACIGVILATGTPMKNGRPANIFPLLLGIRHKVSNNKIEFEKRYCNARKTHFCQWDITGASNLPELRSIIGPSLLRKTKVKLRLLSIIISN